MQLHADFVNHFNAILQTAQCVHIYTYILILHLLHQTAVQDCKLHKTANYVLFRLSRTMCTVAVCHYPFTLKNAIHFLLWTQRWICIIVIDNVLSLWNDWNTMCPLALAALKRCVQNTINDWTFAMQFIATYHK